MAPQGGWKKRGGSALFHDYWSEVSENVMYYILSKALTRRTYTNRERRNETAVSAENAQVQYFFKKPDRLWEQAVSSTSSGIMECVHDAQRHRNIWFLHIKFLKDSNPPRLHQLEACIVCSACKPSWPAWSVQLTRNHGLQGHIAPVTAMFRPGKLLFSRRARSLVWK